MFSQEELREIFRRLTESFPEEAVERTRGAITRKGYDTTGIKYQYVVNRLNEVLGVGGFRVERDFTVKERQSKSGGTLYEVTCDLVMRLGRWEDGKFLPFAEATGTGGHTAVNEADAKKGAFTNGFKKVAAFFGCGWQAYAGCLDDDNVPGLPDRPPTDQSWMESGSGGAEQRSTGNGRITSAQLAKLRELVDELGGEWSRYRDHIREKHSVSVEDADRRLASDLIDSLIATSRKRRANGDSEIVRPS